MKNNSASRWLYRSLVGVAGSAVVILSSSCATTYDAYGQPRQSVDPGVALAGVAAAGLVGYALANDNDGYRGSRSHYGYGSHYGGYNNYNRYSSYTGYGGYGSGYGGGYGGSCYY